LVVPVARKDDIVGQAHRGELTMKTGTERAGFVAGDDAIASGELLLYPLEKVRRLVTLRRLGAGPILLARR
jgi:hypothetical protein